VISWDEKWFFIDQRFEKNGSLVAAGLVKGLFRGPAGSVPTGDVLSRLGAPAAPPARPEGVRLWMESEAALRAAGGGS
jgi:hypothetical protein